LTYGRPAAALFFGGLAIFFAWLHSLFGAIFFFFSLIAVVRSLDVQRKILARYAYRLQVRAQEAATPGIDSRSD